MNAAAKVINQSNLFNGQFTDLRLSKSLFFVIVLSFAVLLSAMAVIYTTNAYRIKFNQVEQAEQQKHRLQMQWGQLLLEQASLATSSRVEQLAHNKLGMILPPPDKKFILQIQ
ncbi:cell division protein FtsL [Legionella israelensis]|uniref:Cell division protein FtsL n=1 Tax=Legionella israelensis TaxID=454 RepID=A0A0W0VK64_9GAMM|nr:cell division protein FtsL [Legionella israelensis]KTD20517.1 cell division transmembrane protein FtsL [Legionella israelensis]QBR83922.1 cell division protein FtsL [Legionella israelensis]QBS10806.1 cell division protein FtsL [Legionella israelensis]QDP72980.1 cell division protein FtsL [Legionella israelensis]SCX85897.1 cell division protein FtsL [Legionella israelensis DSM 19235]